jgi:1-acyl-sn-glycerol-3-phosphate acyltransferase
VTQTWALIKLARSQKSVFLSILGVSWFWLLGSVYLAQIPNLVRTHLAGGPSVVTLILTVFTFSIAAGSLMCERLSGRKIEIGLVPLGALGVSVFGIDAYFAMGAISGDGFRDAWTFLGAPGTVRLLLDLALIGMFGGMFVIPMQALIQARTPGHRRARVIAVNNVINALFMVIGAALAIVWLTLAGGQIPQLLLTVALVNLLIAAYIFKQVPEFTMRFLIWLLSHTMYRVTHHGLEKIPDRGGAIIVCNHVSFVDALLLAGAVRRPIRFVMYKQIFEIPVLNFVFRTGRAIPIMGRREDEEVFEAAFKTIREGLQSGDLLCIFPEGKLTTDGEIDTFRPGIERILKETPVPVIPMALKGLWGSFFSHKEGAFKHPSRFRSRVDVVAGPVLRPEALTADALQARVTDLRGDAA